MKIKNQLPSGTVLPLPAEIKLAKDSTKELPKMAILAYTGKPVDLRDYGIDTPVVYNVEGIKMAKKKIPYLLDHYRPLGHIDGVVIHQGQITATAVHSYPSQESRDVAGAIENEMPYESSVGLDVNIESAVFHEKGTVRVNNQNFEAPLIVIGESTLTEISATLFGRDGDTQVTKLSKDILMKIKNSVPSTPPDDKKEEQAPPAEKKVENSAPPEKKKEVEKKVENSAPPVEKKEVPVITQDHLFNALDWMDEFKDHLPLVKNAIKNGWDKERLEREVKLAQMDNFKGVPSVFVANTKVENGFAARLAISVGIKPEFLETKLGKAAVDHALSEPKMGLREGLMLCANAEGGRFNGHSDVHNLSKFIRERVVNHNSFSTINFPNLMNQVADWKMEEAWKLDEPFAPQIAMPESHRDFRPTGHLSPIGGEMWHGLNKEQKIDHGSYGGENTYVTNLATVAQIVTFKREDIINDNIGWIEAVLDMMIEGALMVPDYQLTRLIYNGVAAGVLVDGVSKFDLPLTPENLEIVHNSIKHGTETRSEVAVKVRRSTKYVLVVASGLEKTAWEIINQERFVQGPAGEFVGERNYWKDKFQVKIFDQLDNTTYHPDAKEGAWGLVPVSQRYAPFSIAYLNGKNRPTTETVSLPADELGFGVRGWWDVNMNYRPVRDNKLQATAWSFPADES